MRRLFCSFPLLAVLVLAVGCSGSAAPTAVDLGAVRTTAHRPDDPPRPPDRPNPPAGCPSFWQIAVTLTEPASEQVYPGKMMVDTCTDADDPMRTFIAFRLDRSAEVLKVPSFQTDCPEGVDGLCYAGSRTVGRGDREHGAKLEWHTRFRIFVNAAGEREVVGSLSRTRSRWHTDRNGEKHEREDVLTATFTGSPMAGPPAPPERPGEGGR